MKENSYVANENRNILHIESKKVSKPNFILQTKLIEFY